MRRSTSFLAVLFLICSGLAVVFWISSGNASAQAQQPDMLVIEGGTLIDGNGGEPISDPVIIIQGNKITNVSRKGQVSYPSSARVIRADGKFILPGLWEVESVYRTYCGEAELAYGVTSVADIGEGGDLLGLHREAVNRGKAGGPRLFTGIARIGPLGAPDITHSETPLTPGQILNSVDDARLIARRMLAAGADLVNLQGGGYPVDYYRAAIEEAHKVGKPAFVRPGGPMFLPKDAALADADILSHSDGIATAIASDPSKWMRVSEDNELDAYADMDDSKAAELIQLLVQHKVAVQPTLIRKGRGFHKETARFLEEDREWWLSNPGLRAYYPAEMFESELLETTPNEHLVDRERKSKGYENMLRFHNEFVQAGGHLLAGGNSPLICPPGLCMHQEQDIFADAGLKPMQLIQSVTRWPAEAYRVLDKLGTIETGKLADVVIVKADPLQNIRNLREIDSVIYDGKIQDLGYHAGYRPPFRGGAGLDGNLVVEDLAWAEALKTATFHDTGPTKETATDPGGPVRVSPPGIEAISPYIVTQGSGTVTLTIKGFSFYEKCLVYFDNTIVPSQVVSPTEIQVTLNERLLQQVGRYDIVVKNPGPLINQQSWRARDGTSNKAHLMVNFKY